MADKLRWKSTLLVAVGISLAGSSLMAATNVCTVPAPVAQSDDFIVGLASPIRIDPLANDSHPEGIPLYVTGFAGNPCLQQAEGTLCLNSDETFTYTRAAGFEGDFTFTYHVTDGLTAVGPVPVLVRPFEDLGGGRRSAPVAGADTVVVPDGASQKIITASFLLANDSDPDGDPLSIRPEDLGAPSKGSLLVTGTDADGAVTELTFVSTQAFETAGSDQFTYVVRDPTNLASLATVAVYYEDGVLNGAPTANPDSYDLKQAGIRTWKWQEILDNDTDPDAEDSLSVAIYNPPLDCCWTFDAAGFTYEPPDSFTGTVSFTYKATDGRAESNLTTVSVTVKAPQIQPYVAVDDFVSVQAYGRVLIHFGGSQPQPNLAGNDTAPTPLHAVQFLYYEPQHGRLEFTRDGQAVYYIPDDGYVGSDSFSYTLKERFPPLTQDSATVHVDVTPVSPDPPPLVVVTDDFLVEPGGQHIVHWDELLDSDQGTELFFLGSSVADLTRVFGHVEWVTPGYDLVNGGSLPEGYKGALRYVNTSGAAGNTDFYHYQVFSNATSELQLSTVNYQLIDPAAWDFLAMSDEVSTVEGQPVDILWSFLQSNDDLTGGEPILNVGGLSRPRYGSFTHLTNPAGVTYTPPKDFVGVDYFSYRVRDDSFQRDDTVARVYVLVYPGKPTPADDGPTVLYQDESIDLDVLANDTDPNQAEGDSLTIFGVEPPLYGAAARVDTAAGERIRYSAPAGFTGSDSFVYTVRDNFGLTAQATAEVLVLLNLPPQAVPRIFCDGLHCRLDGSASTDDHGLVSYEWAVTGPQGTQSATGVSALIDLPVVGDYTVALTVADFRGKPGTTELQVTVDGAAGDPPFADFTASCVTVVCDFDASLSRDDVEVTGFSWDFGDGSPMGSGSKVTHTYPATGTYQVTLIAEDASGTQGATVKPVSPVTNSAPVAVEDATTARPETAKTIRVLSNDSDPEGLPVTVTSVALPLHGTASVQPDGTILYLSEPGFKGTDRFTYEITDGESSATGEVSVWVLTQVDEIILLMLSP